MRCVPRNYTKSSAPPAESMGPLCAPGSFLPPGEESMKLQELLCRMCMLGLVVLLAGVPVLAQGETPPEGINQGNYNVKQTVEFGYRYTNFTGNRDVFNTFVNLNPGPRLLEQTLEMRSLNHRGALFDDLYLSNFGYGGEPNTVSRLRMYKNKWYNLSGTFRRNRNLWDFNLLANPLNPPNSNPFVPIPSSPHAMELSRRMTDVNLTLLPQSRVRFRLGYSRNINEGPSVTTFHEGTDVLAFQQWKTTLNSYSFGVDVRILPKTNISYDQFFYYYKGDTTWEDRSQTFRLPNGVPVDLGIIFNTPANQPCSAPISDATTVPPTANPACNGYITYNRQGRVRTDYPTEQISFQSNYFRNVDLSGRFLYSSSKSDVFDYQEFYQGLVTRTRQREFAISGPAETKRVNVTADFAATWRATEKFRVVDTFHFAHFRLPGFFDVAETSLFGTSMVVPPNIFTPGPAPPPSCPTITSPGCPQHTSSSPADIVSEQFSLYLGQETRTNQVEVLYDHNRRLGGRLGYRYANREITHKLLENQDLLFFPTLPNRGACAGQPLLPDGSCRAVVEGELEIEQTKINEHSALVGVWARPVDTFRIAFDLELFYADQTFTRVSPRQFQLYRLRTSYRLVDWATVNASVYILERRNNVAEIAHKMHDRSYSFSAMLAPNDNFTLDFGYDYNDLFSQTNICFTGTVRPPGTSPCPTAVALLQQISLYNHDTHYAYVRVLWKPHWRVTATGGYAATATNGSTLILTPNTPPGTLQYVFHKPYGGVDVGLNRNLTWRTRWGYYGYGEKEGPDPTTGPRDFRGNLLELSLRWAF